MMQAAIYGRLGSDPKSIQTKTGTTMAVASLAVELPTRDEKPVTEWLGVVAFGRVAETLLRHKKGELLSASGRAQLNIYRASDEMRKELQIIADSIVSARSVRPGGGRKKADRASPDDGEPFNDEVPF